MFKLVNTLAFLLSAIALLGLGNGLMFTLLGLRMSLEGTPHAAIGVVGAAYFAGMLAATRLAPRLIHRIGHIRAFSAFAAGAAIAAMLHALLPTVAVWVALRAAMGYCSAGMFMVAESWLQAEVTNRSRARTYALYAIAGSAGGAVGPLLVNLADPLQAEGFGIASMLFAASLLPVALTRVANPVLGDGGRLGLRALLAISPLAVVGAVSAGLIASAFSALAPAYGESMGLGAVTVSLLMAAYRVGGFTLQYPIGSVGDRVERRHVVFATALAGVAVTAALTLLGPSLGALVLAGGFLLGGAAQPLYGLVAAHAYDRLERRDFVAASGGLLFAWGLGASLGPLIAGPIMQAVGPSGLFLYMTVLFLGLAGFVLHRMSERAPVPAPSGFVVTAPNMPASTRLDPRAGADDDQGKT